MQCPFFAVFPDAAVVVVALFIIVVASDDEESVVVDVGEPVHGEDVRVATTDPGYLKYNGGGHSLRA